VASLHTLWNDLAPKLPSDVSIQVENTGDIIEDTTGDLTGAWSATAVAVVNGGDGGIYAAPVGAVIDWNTETIVHARRLRGRTFLVPLAGNNFEDDGSLATSPMGVIQTAADAFIASQSASFVIWHRGTGSDGSNGLVLTSKVPDLAAILRSRRD
jgi:hypothetical protein